MLERRNAATSRRGVRIGLACWAGISAVFFAVHAVLWMHGRSLVLVETWGWFLKPIGNVVHIFTVPGWLFTKIALDSWGEADLLDSLVACAIGAGVLMLFGAWLLAVRRSLSGLSSDRVKDRDSAMENSVTGQLTRRRMLVDGFLLGTTATAGAVIADSACFAPGRLRLQRYEIPIADLPEEFNGVRLVQLTDTHLGPRVPREFIDRAIDMALELRPDVFLLTGDYIHSGAEWIEPAAAMFRRLTATGRPVIGVLGNHDWFNGGPAVRRALRDAGVVVIDNDRVFLSRSASGEVSLLDSESEPASGSLCIAGFGDLREDHIDPDAALKGVNPAIVRLVLAHNPDSAEQRCVTKPGAHRIDLMISGHTHGGQVRIPGLGTGAGVMSRFGEKYASGLVQGPVCRVVISNGVGISLVPFRFMVPPEVVEITLLRAAPADSERKVDRV